MPDLLKILRQCGHVSFGVAVGVIGLEEVAEVSAVTVVGVIALADTLDDEPPCAGWMTLEMLRKAFPMALTLMDP